MYVYEGAEQQQQQKTHTHTQEPYWSFKWCAESALTIYNAIIQFACEKKSRGQQEEKKKKEE